MESLNQRVITGVAEWLRLGEPCWLATVVRTYGSSPRPDGSLFAFNPKRGALGSLSGGCIEEDLLASLASRQSTVPESPRLLRYGVTQEERTRFALPCGGELHVLLEDLRPNRDSREHFLQLQQLLANRRPVVRHLDLTSGKAWFEFDRAASFVLSANKLRHPLAPVYKLLLVGAGEVAHYVALFSRALDFDVTLCDPRESFLRSWTLTEFEIVQALPDDLIRARFSDAQCAILALAHDPRIDDLAMLEACTTSAFYVGAMGSEATSAERRARLAELGLSSAQLDRLHGPIGLPIHSKTPAEIAVSVLAHVVSERNRIRLMNSTSQVVTLHGAETRPGCRIESNRLVSG